MPLLSTGPQHPGGCVRRAQNELRQWEHAPQSQPHQPCCKPKSSPSSTGQRCSIRAPKRPGFGIPEANRPPTCFRSFSEVPGLPQLVAVQKRACSEGLSTRSCWLGKEMLSGAPVCGGVSKRGIGMGIGIIPVLPSPSTFLPLETHSTSSDRAQRAEVAEEAPSEHILGGIPHSWWAQGAGQWAGSGGTARGDSGCKRSWEGLEERTRHRRSPQLWSRKQRGVGTEQEGVAQRSGGVSMKMQLPEDRKEEGTAAAGGELEEKVPLV